MRFLHVCSQGGRVSLGVELVPDYVEEDMLGTPGKALPLETPPSCGTSMTQQAPLCPHFTEESPKPGDQPHLVHEEH